MLDEPEITINGHALSPAQAMAVRVAVGTFYAEMSDADALGADDHGRRMTAGYRARLGETLGLMSPAPRQSSPNPSPPTAPR